MGEGVDRSIHSSLLIQSRSSSFIYAFYHLAVDDEGEGGDEGDASEVVPDVVCIGTGLEPFIVGGEQGRFGAVLAKQETRDAETEDGGEERVQVAETQIEAFFALGCLKREILKETR